jgi:choline kinase
MKLVILAAGIGSRLRQESGRRPKALLDVGGASLFDRHVELAESSGLEPVVVTRAEYAADFRRKGVEVLIEEPTPHVMVTLANACRRLPPGPLCWVCADMLFADPAPLRELIATHLQHDCFSSFFYVRSNRFKAKLELTPEPAVTVTWNGTFERSIPNFLVHAERVAPWLPGELADPRGCYLQRAIERGERIHFQEYPAAVFEIDTPDDLAEARRYFARCA